jgi:ATP/maltotriose-dependent transcriptional regulator MalT
MAGRARPPEVVSPVVSRPVVNGPVVNGPVVNGPVVNGPVVNGTAFISSGVSSPRGGMLDGVATRVTSPVLVGRTDQMRALEHALDEVGRAVPATVLIGGEAGVGKSRFLAEFSVRARQNGARVLTGGCLGLAHGGLPYAPFTAMLRELVRDLGTDGVTQLLGGRGTRELARLLPEFGEPGAGHEGDTDPGEERARLFEVVLSLLEALADGGSAVVLVIEDLHWAERSTRDLLSFLVSNQRAADGLLIIASFRSDELHRTHPLRPLLAELDRIAWVERADLPRLSRRDCAELITRILGREADQLFADGVFERTEGNPLFVEALLGSGGGLSGALPESLHDLLAASVRRLPEETQDALSVASAAGERVGHSLLAAVTGLSGDALAAALRPAVAANVLVTDADGYAFRHALIREVVYEDLLPGENARLHTRFADAIGADPSLVSAGRAAVELAHHAYAAHDVAGALTAAWRAAREAGHGLAPAEQAALLSRVLELWDKVPDAEQRIGADHVAVLTQAARAAEEGWEVERAAALAAAALKEIDVSTDPLRAAELLQQRGMMRYYTGRPEDALADLQVALETARQQQLDALRATVLRNLAWMFRDSKPDEALASAREALEAARAAGDADAEALALMTVAVTGPGRGVATGTEALDLMGQARMAAGQAGYRTQLQVAITESHLLEGMGEHERSAAVAREGVALARSHGLARTDGSLLAVNLAEPLAALGRWDEAAEVIEHALDLSPGTPALLAAVRLFAGELALVRGDIAAAAGYALVPGLSPEHPGIEPQFGLPMAQLQAQVHLAEGRPTEALQAIDAVLERFDVRLTPRYGWPVLAVGALVCAMAGLAGTAGRDQNLSATAMALLTRLQSAAGQMDVTGPLQEAHRLTFAAEVGAAGQTLRSGGSPRSGQPAVSGARSGWDDAAAAWDRVSQPYQRATALLRAAEAAIADGDRDGGQTRLLAAAQLADRLGARQLGDDVRLLARRARITLPAAGARPGNQPAVGPAGESAGIGPIGGGNGLAGVTADAARGRFGLTEREFEVLRLVAGGQSNREIAAELFISAKTASVHVSNILAKLGASSRVEAAATAYRLRLFDALPVS